MACQTARGGVLVAPVGLPRRPLRHRSQLGECRRRRCRCSARCLPPVVEHCGPAALLPSHPCCPLNPAALSPLLHHHRLPPAAQLANRCCRRTGHAALAPPVPCRQCVPQARATAATAGPVMWRVRWRSCATSWSRWGAHFGTPCKVHQGAGGPHMPAACGPPPAPRPVSPTPLLAPPLCSAVARAAILAAACAGASGAGAGDSGSGGHSCGQPVGCAGAQRSPAAAGAGSGHAPAAARGAAGGRALGGGHGGGGADAAGQRGARQRGRRPRGAQRCHGAPRHRGRRPAAVGAAAPGGAGGHSA